MAFNREDYNSFNKSLLSDLILSQQGRSSKRPRDHSIYGSSSDEEAATEQSDDDRPQRLSYGQKTVRSGQEEAATQQCDDDRRVGRGYGQKTVKEPLLKKFKSDESLLSLAADESLSEADDSLSEADESLSETDESSSETDESSSEASDETETEEDEAEDLSTVDFVCKKTIPIDSEALACVKFDPSGLYLATCSWSKTIKIYSLECDSIFAMNGHTQGCSEVSWSPDGTQLLSASDDKTIRIWDMRTSVSIGTLRGHTDSVMCVNFNRQADKIISGSFDKHFRFWDNRKTKRELWKKDLGDTVCSVQFNPMDGSNFITALNYNQVYQWDTMTKKLQHKLDPLSLVSTASAQYTSDGQSVLASFNDSKLVLWKPKTDERKEFTATGHTCRRFSIVPTTFENRYVISGSDDGKICIWNMENKEPVQTLSGHNDTVIWVSSHPQNDMIASADLSGNIKIWQNNRKCRRIGI